MKIKHIIISLLLSAALCMPAVAQKVDTSELASPLIALMPALMKIRADLNLSEEQNKVIDAWLAEAPAKKKALQKNALAIRAELREAILNRDNRYKREELKYKLSEANRRIIEMQSLCARMLHNTLTDEQYAKVVAAYRQSAKQ
ncbi:hypothetical protein [Thiolapillus sp.]